MALQTFMAMANAYDPALATGVNRVVQNGIANCAPTMAAGLTLYVMTIGWQMMFRRMRWGDFVAHATRAVCIAFLMTAAGFNQMVAVPAMETIPAWIAQSSNNATGVNAGAQQFELIWSAVQHQTAAILEQASGLENIGYRFEAGWITGCIGFLLSVAFWVYEFSRMIMGLLVATLPFVLFLYLFEATRSIPMSLARMGVGMLVLQLMLSIMLQIMLQGDAFFMQQVFTVGGMGLDEQVSALRNVSVFFLFGVGMVVFIPGIAAYVGGGVALNVGGHLMRAAGPGAAQAARQLAGGAGRAGNRLIGRARA